MGSGVCDTILPGTILLVNFTCLIHVLCRFNPNSFIHTQVKNAENSEQKRLCLMVLSCGCEHAKALWCCRCCKDQTCLSFMASVQCAWWLCIVFRCQQRGSLVNCSSVTAHLPLPWSHPVICICWSNVRIQYWQCRSIMVSFKSIADYWSFGRELCRNFNVGAETASRAVTLALLNAKLSAKNLITSQCSCFMYSWHCTAL